MRTAQEMFYKISITGDLGSGKSTVCNILKEKLPAEVVSVGSIQRQMAKEKGMTTYEFNKYMESHPEIDNTFDNMLKEYDKVSGKNILFDSRLAWSFVPTAFSVYVTTDLFVAATRVYNANRDNEGYASVEEAMQKLSDRRGSEILRYSSIYGLNIKNLDNYDLIVDSTSASPDEVARVILEEYEKYFNGEAHHRRYLSPARLYPLSTAAEGGRIVAFEYENKYYVTSGLGDLRRATKEEKLNEVYCKLLNLSVEQKQCMIKEGCSVEFLKQWEEENQIKFVRYPL